jgi:hypothetical protein
MRLNNIFKTLFGKKETQPEIIKQVNIEPATLPVNTKPVVTRTTEIKKVTKKEVSVPQEPVVKKEVSVPQEPVVKKLKNKSKTLVIKQLKK